MKKKKKDNRCYYIESRIGKQYGYVIEKSAMMYYTSNHISTSNKVYLHTPCYSKLGALRLLDEGIQSFVKGYNELLWYSVSVSWVRYIIRPYNVRNAVICKLLRYAGVLIGKYTPENPVVDDDLECTSSNLQPNGLTLTFSH